MPHFIVEYVQNGTAEERAARRGEHIAYRKSLGDAMPLAGPLLDDDGDPIGSLIIVAAGDRAEAAAIATADPYVVNGLLDLLSVRPYRIAAIKPV